MRKISLNEYKTWRWKCPDCNYHNSEIKIADDVQCQKCFKSFGVENKTEGIIEISVCARCGHQISQGAIICYGCNKKDPEIKFIQFK